MKNILLKKKSNIIFLIAGLYLLIATNVQAQVLDETFGNKGLVTTHVTTVNESGYPQNAISDIALQGDGKIVAVGNLIRDIQLGRYQI
ncbi:MAG TPA: hypothetical protein PLP23_23000 [Panacibacter sp.]|nr:hypothetical protein [Panacibacter sp.]